jgi:DNA-binding transcriptional MerR regulator
MVVKARVQKRLYYKIGEACKELGIQPYVLRYWETEFPALAPSKSRSGQRVYSEKELEVIRRIKQLLYEEGYTIAGAKKKLETELVNGSLEEAEGTAAATAATVATAAEESPAAEAPAAAPPRTARKKAVVSAAVTADTPPVLDSDAAERIQKLRSGVEKALQEAREILALLDSKSP